MSKADARVAIVIATAGRRQIVEATLPYLLRQEYANLEYHVIAPDIESLPERPKDSSVMLHVSAKGLTTQRNHALRVISPAVEYVFYFDDDAVPHPAYVREMVAVFEDRSDVVAGTGDVLADGAKVGRELSISIVEPLFSGEARKLRSSAPPSLTQLDLYGCNFAVRRSVLEAERFDEVLPSYGWLEDQDFARRARRHGTIALVPSASVVHLGAKSGGRTDHRRLGYWQVCNPIYLQRKGSFTLALASRQVFKPLAANLIGSLHPFRGWRRERLWGNLIAFAHSAAAPPNPRRALEL